MRRVPRGPGAAAAWIGALLIAMLLAGGCGSSGDTTSVAGADRSGESEAPGSTSRAQTAKSGSGPEATARSEARHRRSGNEKAKAGHPQGAPGQGSVEVARAVDRAAVRECLARFGRAVCKEMVRQAAAPSTRIDKPSDCLKAMSRARCEELAAAQGATEEHGDSVNLEKCIENPTPKCEAILRPILEAQRGR